MTPFDAGSGRFSSWRERLLEPRRIGVLENISAHIRTLSSGDRVLFYICSLFLGIASLSGIYALEQSLLIQVPAYGGTLVEGEVGSPRFINPLLALSDADRDLSVLTYAGLMGLSGSGTLVPVLAESYTLSDDGKVYTFMLRPDAKFSDGKPVTASDVAFTVKKAQNATLKSPEFANWSGVKTEVIDEKTVSFTLAKPYAPFLEITTLGILPERLWRDVTDEQFPFSNLQTNPVGAGPFKISKISYDANGIIERIQLRANPYYALGRPYLDRIDFTFYPRAEDLAAALTDGTIDSAYGVAAPNVLMVPYARVFGVFFNQDLKQVYARTEVRKALSLALDRESIVQNILGGYAVPIIGPVPPGGSVTQTPVPQSDNPTETAATVLEKAGWSYDSTGRVWKNVSIKQVLDTITIRTSNVPELKNVATAVKKQWEKLGIPVTVELYEPGDLSQNVIRPRKYESLLYGMVIGRNQDLYAFWDSQERNDPGLNIALYANKTVDALLEDARTNPDPDMRTRDLQKIEDLVAADYPAAFIYAPDFIYAVPDDLKGVTLPQIVTPADRFANIAFWYRETDAVWPIFVKTR